MVSAASIVNMVIDAIVCFLLPVIVFVYFKRKEKISFKPVIIGAAVFFIFAMILERLVHMVVLGNNLITGTLWFTVYGALAAGIFEEVGRFIAFKTVLKNDHEWKDGLAFGIGHGGIEAILIGSGMNIQYIIYSKLINSGVFDTVIGSKVPASQLAQLQEIKAMLIQASAGTFLLGSVERICALAIHLALTMVVLYAVKYRKNIYLLAAILLHALMDVPAALYQTKAINIYAAEVILAVYFIIAMIFLFRTKRLLSKEAALCSKTLGN